MSPRVSPGKCHHHRHKPPHEEHKLRGDFLRYRRILTRNTQICTVSNLERSFYYECSLLPHVFPTVEEPGHPMPRAHLKCSIVLSGLTSMPMPIMLLHLPMLKRVPAMLLILTAIPHRPTTVPLRTLRNGLHSPLRTRHRRCRAVQRHRLTFVDCSRRIPVAGADSVGETGGSDVGR